MALTRRTGGSLPLTRRTGVGFAGGGGWLALTRRRGVEFGANEAHGGGGGVGANEAHGGGSGGNEARAQPDLRLV